MKSAFAPQPVDITHPSFIPVFLPFCLSRADKLSRCAAAAQAAQQVLILTLRLAQAKLYCPSAADRAAQSAAASAAGGAAASGEADAEDTVCPGDALVHDDSTATHTSAAAGGASSCEDAEAAAHARLCERNFRVVDPLAVLERLFEQADILLASSTAHAAQGLQAALAGGAGAAAGSGGAAPVPAPPAADADADDVGGAGASEEGSAPVSAAPPHVRGATLARAGFALLRACSVVAGGRQCSVGLLLDAGVQALLTPRRPQAGGSNSSSNVTQRVLETVRLSLHALTVTAGGALCSLLSRVPELSVAIAPLLLPLSGCTTTSAAARACLLETACVSLQAALRGASGGTHAPPATVSAYRTALSELQQVTVPLSAALADYRQHVWPAIAPTLLARAQLLATAASALGRALPTGPSAAAAAAATALARAALADAAGPASPTAPLAEVATSVIAALRQLVPAALAAPPAEDADSLSPYPLLGVLQAQTLLAQVVCVCGAARSLECLLPALTPWLPDPSAQAAACVEGLQRAEAVKLKVRQEGDLRRSVSDACELATRALLLCAGSPLGAPATPDAPAASAALEGAAVHAHSMAAGAAMLLGRGVSVLRDLAHLRRDAADVKSLADLQALPEGKRATLLQTQTAVRRELRLLQHGHGTAENDLCDAIAGYHLLEAQTAGGAQGTTSSAASPADSAAAAALASVSAAAAPGEAGVSLTVLSELWISAHTAADAVLPVDPEAAAAGKRSRRA